MPRRRYTNCNAEFIGSCNSILTMHENGILNAIFPVLFDEASILFFLFHLCGVFSVDVEHTGKNITT